MRQSARTGTGSRSVQPPRRALRAAAAALLLVTATLLAGCLDTLLPQSAPPEGEEGPGKVRVWAAATPGALGREFAHYNVSFGPVRLATDVYLANHIAMKSHTPTVDLVRMERDAVAAPLAELIAPPGEYFGIATNITRASVAVDRIVGTRNGEAIVRAEETPILHNLRTSNYRAEIHVFGGRTTDIFIEIDLQRSLLRSEGGELQHVTIPSRLSVVIDGVKVTEFPYDGGRSRLDPDDPRYQHGQAKREIPRTQPPTVRFRATDAGSEDRLYSSFPGTTSKRLNRALGLDQSVQLDGTDSFSSYRTADGPVRIVEYEWDFGDGTTQRGARVTKAYEKGGIHDIVLSVRDAVDLVASDHFTVFVPYIEEQASRRQHENASGMLLLPGTDPPTPGTESATHRFVFPDELSDGHLRLGGYRVEVQAADPLGGSYAGAMDLRVGVQSGHFAADATGSGPFQFATAGVPAWRGPLSGWVDDELLVTVALQTGVLVGYDIAVEAHYYENLSRGLDPHGGHIHSEWTLGPAWQHLSWNGTVAPRE